MTDPRIDIPLDKIADFCRKWKITELSLFGSVLRDDFGPDSDIDVLVAFAPDSTCSYWDWPDIEDDLRAIFGTDRKIDIVAADGLRNPFRRHRIMSTRQVLYAA